MSSALNSRVSKSTLEHRGRAMLAQVIERVAERYFDGCSTLRLWSKKSDTSPRDC